MPNDDFISEAKKVRYENTDILINKFGILDATKLDIAENQAFITRLNEPLPEKADCKTYDGYKAMHEHLLQDVYEWAGEERKYSTSRGDWPYAQPEQIAKKMEAVFDRLKADNFLSGLDQRAFAEKAANYVNEINSIHPFIEGNGRSQRVWLRQLAQENGIELKFDGSQQEREQWHKGQRFAHMGYGDKIIADMLSDRMTERSYARSQIQEKGQNQMSESAYDVKGNREIAYEMLKEERLNQKEQQLRRKQPTPEKDSTLDR